MADPEALQAFGRRVRAAREAKGLSQESLADLAALHRTYVSSAERGERNVSLTNILRLARALDVRPGELVDGLQP
jgi:transcriptional regulator with XRE-family HTH domain